MSDETIERLLDAVLQLEDQADRQAYLDRVCHDNSALRQKLDALIQEHLNADQFFDDIDLGFDEVTQACEPADGVELDLAENVGSVIGRFTLLEKIGEGGMGVVYMAEQSEPVTRKVALKIIKLGMDTKQVVARFRAERQALALMDHPNIARVLDGGATETGRPYFVMELVNGIPITEFCERYKLPTQERIELFLPVCKAIQSAHQKGIIHRDIKPSNVLVSFLHGEAIAKVIDFGIAKAINQKLTEKTLFTRFGALIGTPAYMSPEQAEMSVIDVDTRTDVYSLGVLLYELLTGTTPLPEKRLRSAGYAEIQRIIAEEEPEKPSTRLTRIKTASTDTQRDSPSNAPHSAARLDPDLDWVTMKCLEKDRRRRYESANDLAADLNRHLNNEPVLAVAPSLSYQFAKFRRRHRGLVRTAIFTTVVLLVTTAVSVGFGLWNAKLRGEAETAKKEAQDQAIQLENNLYVSDMLAVEDAVAKEEFRRAEQILLQHQTELSGRDLRGFEWRFYWQASRGKQLRSFQAHNNLTNRRAVNRSRISQIHILEQGRQFLTSGNDWKTRLWNTSSDQPVHEWEGGGFSLSPNEQFIGFFNRDRQIEIWDLKNLELVRSESFPDRQINHFTFTHDNQNIVSMTSSRSDNGEITLQVSVTDIASGEEVFTPKGMWGDYAISPTAPLLWTIGSDQKISGNDSGDWKPKTVHGYLWNYQEGKQIRSPIESHGMGARFSPSGELIAISYSTAPFNMNARIDTHIYKVATGEQVSILEDFDLGATINAPSTVAFSKNEELLAAPRWTGSMTIDVWEIASGERVARYTGHSGRVNSLIFHPRSDDILISSSSDKTLQYWNCRKNQTIERYTGRDYGISSLDVDESGDLVITGGDGGRLSFWPPYVASPTKGFPYAPAITSLPIFSSQERYLVLGERTAESPPLLRHLIVGSGAPPPKIKRSVFEADTTKPLWEIPRTEKALGFSLDGRHLHTVSTNQFFTRAVADGSIESEVDLESPVTNIDFDRPIPRLQNLSPDATVMATFNQDNTIRLISLTTGRTISSLDQACQSHSVGFTASGKKLFFTTTDGNKSGIWDISQDDITWMKTKEDGWITGKPTPSPDEELLAGVCYDKSVRVWNLNTGELLQTFNETDNNKAFFTPDNRCLAIGQSRRANNPKRLLTTLKLVDRRTWRQIAELHPPGNARWVSQNVFSPTQQDMLYESQNKINLLSTPTLEEIDASIELMANQ